MTVLIASLILMAWHAAAAVNPAPVQVFYVTLPETDGLTVMTPWVQPRRARPRCTPTSPSPSPVAGTYVYYDQWENGYDADLANPTDVIYNGITNPDGVQIWGNGLAADGCAPNIAGVPVTCTDANDVLNAGDVIIPYNVVPVPRDGAQPT